MRTRSTSGRSTATAIIVDADVASVKQKTSHDISSYNKEAISLLRNTFTKVSVDAIRRIFVSSGNSFRESYRILSSIRDSSDEQNDEAQARKRILKIAPALKNVRLIILKSNRKVETRRPRNTALLAELDVIDEMNTKENRPVDNAEAKRENESKSAPPSESLFECLCCYNDECQFETMCQCDEGHLVCGDCLRHHVEEEMYGKDKGTLKCIDLESDGCTASYSSTQLDKVFSPKSRAKVDEKMFRFNLEQVEMDDTCKCPKCDYIFVLRSGFTYTQVFCPECKHPFCHKCNEVPHKGKTCEEAKDEKENLGAHATAADAMTEAVVRKCPNPKCNKRFFKEEGCNKMKCPSCKTSSCYICRKALDSKEPYKHFCQTNFCQHESCGKCVLYTDTKENDRQARREVAQAALLAEQKKDGATNAATLIGGLLSPPQKVPLHRALFAGERPAAANEALQPLNAVAQQQPVQARRAPLRDVRNEPMQQPNDDARQQQQDRHRHAREQDVQLNVQDGALARVEQRNQNDRQPLQNAVRPIVAFAADMQLLVEGQGPRQAEPTNIDSPTGRRDKRDRVVQPAEGGNNRVGIEDPDEPEQQEAEEANGCIIS